MRFTGPIRALFHRNGPVARTRFLPPAKGGEPELVSPFVAEFVLVECAHYIGLAYQDAEQNWRTAYTDTKLPAPVKILE